MQACLVKSRTWITDSSAFSEEATCLFPCAFVFNKYSLFGREELTVLFQMTQALNLEDGHLLSTYRTLKDKGHLITLSGSSSVTAFQL